MERQLQVPEAYSPAPELSSIKNALGYTSMPSIRIISCVDWPSVHFLFSSTRYFSFAAETPPPRRKN